MAQARSARAINRRGENSVRNLQYGPRTRLVKGMEQKRSDQKIIYTHVHVHTSTNLKKKLTYLTKSGKSLYNENMANIKNAIQFNTDV